MAVLGSMLLDEKAVSIAIEMLKADYFYKDSHRKIFEAICNLFNDAKAVDLVTANEELKRMGILESVGGTSLLTELVNTVPSTINISHYAHLVKEKSILRSLINNANQIAGLAYEYEGNADEALDRAETLIFNIRDSRRTSSAVHLKEIIQTSIEQIDQAYQKKTLVSGLPTGFADLDQKTAGLHPSDLIIVAGRPSMGKSAFALGVTERIGVVNKTPLAFFSLEMSKEQLVQRMICAHARVDAHKVRTGFFAPSDWPKLTAAAGKLSEAPIYVDDTPGISVMELRAKSRRLKAHHDIQFIVLDYLQLMRGRDRMENRQQEISEISRSLKALARELSVPLLAISQLSRAVESRQDRRPQLSDLRESGAIEQDADLVILFLREEYYNPTPSNEGMAEAIIAKQRNGPVGSVKLAFIKEYARFDNLSHREE
ncbi:MAG: replicative DNA helicase [Candidatus Omnitrophica bacterium]|nr:replicative DNA helicase [Candidatus Omnitrophota bacterium]MBU1871317.1 replicative DNA helicase [Candidatus Omnitrophota bacterium]